MHATAPPVSLAPQQTFDALARLYTLILFVGASLLPLTAIWYLVNFSAISALCVEDHAFHEAAIAIATLLGGFVAYVSWRSYSVSGEVFLRWLTAALLVSTLIYAPHGFLTRTAHDNIWLFLLYGPVSRLAMMVCLVYGLWCFGRPSENPAEISRKGFWWRLLGLCLMADLAVAALAYSPIAGSPWLRMTMESLSASLCVFGIALMVGRGIKSPLMKFYAVALAFTAQSCLAFVLAKPWNHLWWLAHAIFACGFLVLSWGVCRALMTTRSFSLAYSQEEMMRRLESERDQTLQSNRALNDAQEIGGVGSFRYSMRSHEWSNTKQLDKILGNEASHLQDYAHWLAHFHPEDQAELSDCWRNVIPTGGFVREFRIVRANDGEIRSVQCVVKLISDSAKMPCVIVGTCQDVTEQKKIVQSLKQATEQAEASNHAKSNFLAMMSHELRTPLNGILGMSQVLLMSELTEDQRQQAEVIIASGNTLLAVLNDILDFSKIEAGKLEIKRVASDPEKIIVTTLAVFEQNGQAKGLTLNSSWQGPANRLYWIDPLRLRQILSNLISNAIKFTDHGQVSLDAAEVDSNASMALLEFSVKDSGIGIPEDKHSLLFQPFTQTEDTITRKYGGTGLGLSIVKRLASLMGGEVGFESEPGQGSRFWLRVPAAIQEHPGHEPLNEKTDDHTAVCPVAECAGQILIVDDLDTNRQVVDLLLKKIGLTTSFANDGREAVEAITRGEPADLILMDIQMPLMNGHQATQLIRQWEAANNLPRRTIIAMTANAYDTERQACFDAGMDDYLSKPIHYDKLKATLARWLPIASLPAPASAVAPALRAADRPPVFDEAQVLSLLDNDRALARIAVQAALRDIPREFDDLALAQRREDHGRVGRCLHTLKGLSLQVGATRMFHRLNRLEKLGDSLVTVQSADSLVWQELQQEQHDLMAALSAWVAGENDQNTGADLPLTMSEAAAISRRLMPLLAQNKFDATFLFRDLQRSVAGTVIAADLAETAGFLDEFRFDLALTSFRNVAAAHNWGSHGQ